MSKQPSCVIEEIIEVDPKEFDGQLGTMLSKCEGDTNKFLTIVFGYLQRKTNFYKDGEAQRKVLEVVAQVEPSIKLKSGSRPAATEATTPKPAAAAPTPSPPAPAPKPEPAPTPASAPAAQPSTSAPAKEDQIQTIDDAEEKPKGLKPNHGRGYDYPHYSWTQTLSEVSVSVPVPSGTKAKMLDVVMAKNKIKVGVKGQPAIIEGELSEAIKPDDCIWNIEGGVVELTLTKHDGMHWWSSVLKGDEPIDVHQVEPENSKLGDLDAETRQTVEKMMFDQRQKALGLPSSDEIKKQEMLKKFMEAHPEMDFSKAKMM